MAPIIINFFSITPMYILLTLVKFYIRHFTGFWASDLTNALPAIWTAPSHLHQLLIPFLSVKSEIKLYIRDLPSLHFLPSPQMKYSFI